MAALRNLLSDDRIWRALVAISYFMILAMPAEAQDRSFEQMSAAFIQLYIQEWVGPAPAALAYMDQVYPDQIDFYGKTLTHEELMNLKRKFVMRWPRRSLNVRPASIQVSCEPSHLCTAQAIFDWHYESQERQAVSTGSASLKLVLQDGMTILSEDGGVVPAIMQAPPEMAQRKPVIPKAARPEAASNVPAPLGAEASPRQDEPPPQSEASSLKRDDIAVLRQDYIAHGADKNWISAWMAQKRDFSSQATYVGFTEDQVGPGPAGVLRTFGFTSAVGTIACINPDNANSLKIGQTVNVNGRITIFIEDVMYLGQCWIQPD